MKTIGIIFLLGTFSTGQCLFEAILTYLEVGIKNGSRINIDDLKVKRFNRTTFVLDGSFMLKFGNIEGLMGICEINRKMGNVYKLLPYKVGPGNLCSFMKEEKMFYPDLQQHCENFPLPGSCDLKDGNYYLKNYLPDLKNLPPVFESGDYMLECKIYRKEETLQILKIYCQIYNIRDAKLTFG